MRLRLQIPARLITATVSELKASARTERVVLWLAERHVRQLVVREVFVPLQYAEEDVFRIPRRGVMELLARLRTRRQMVAAQVHTHPGPAFHSQADDEWAVVRHAGALSLVVPRFCRDTSPDSFLADARVYELTRDNTFVEVPADEAYEVTP